MFASPISPVLGARAATTLVVNTLADAALTTPNGCAVPGAACTLRDAVAAANLSSGSTIQFSVSGTILVTAANGGPPALHQPSIIDGSGHDVVLSGGSASGILAVTGEWAAPAAGAPMPFALRNLVMEQGSASQGGALSYQAGPGEISNVTFRNNHASASGGAIDTISSLLVSASTFSGNSAPTGGAIHVGGNSTISGSTFSGNSADYGGAINNTGPLTVSQDTFSGNSTTANPSVPATPPFAGADIYTSGGNSGISYSTFDSGPGGTLVVANGGGVHVVSSILNAPQPGMQTCATYGGIINGDHNFGSDNFCGGTGGAVMLGTLAARGGPTQTINLLPTSPAIHGGDQAVGVCPATDQRGVTRPAGLCDAGAYQFRPDTATTVTSSGSPSSFGDPVTFTATVAPVYETGIPGGVITFLDNGGSMGAPVTLVNGSAQVSTSSLAAGGHTIAAGYGGDSHFSVSGGQVTHSVAGAASGTFIASSLNPSPAGGAVTFTVTVSNFSAVPTGQVTLKDGTTTLGTVNLSPASSSTSTATYTTSGLTAGPHLVKATYGGDSTSTPSTSAALKQAVQAPTSSQVTTPGSPAVFGPLTFSGQVTAPAGPPRPTGTVTYLTGVGGGAPAVSSAGTTTYAPSPYLPPGTYTITARYSGDDYWAPSTATLSQVIDQAGTTTSLLANPATNTVYKQAFVLSSSVTPAGTTAVPTGQVDFFDGSTAVGSGSLDGTGAATLSVLTAAVGLHHYQARYAGSAGFAGTSSSIVDHTVESAPTMTTLSPSANPSAFGQPVTLSTDVAATSGSGVPGGIVSFFDGTTLLGTGVLDGAAHTSLVTAALAVGNHAITAVYGAADGYLTSTSPVTSQHVTTAATTVTLGADHASSTYGLPVIYTARVVGSAPSTAMGSGTVTLTEGGNTLGTATLDSQGRGTLTLVLPAGAHTISAAFAGDGNLVPASADTTTSVDPATSVLTLALSTAASNFGSPVTLTGTMTASGQRRPTGVIRFLDDTRGLLGDATIDNLGAALLTTSSLAGGTYHVRAYYLPANGNFASSASYPTQSLQVAVAPTTMSLAYSPTTLFAGGQVQITATIDGAVAGQVGPSNWVRLTDGGTTVLDQATVSGGHATLTGFNLKQGGNYFFLTYAGDANYGPSQRGIFINVSGTRPTLEFFPFPSSSISYGETSTLVARVTSSAGLPTGSVTFTDGGNPLGTVALDNTGHAQLDTGLLPSGSHQVAAQYLGDATFAGITSDPVALVVSRALSYAVLTWVGGPSAPRGLTPVTLVGHVGAVLATTQPPITGTLTFVENGVTLGGPVTLVANEAALTLPAGLPAGEHAITLVYSGDVNVLPKSAVNNLHVDFIPTTTTIYFAPPVLRQGTAVTVSAGIFYPAGPHGESPTGAIVIRAGADTCTIPAPGGSCILLPTIPLPTQLSATYAGDALFGPSSDSVARTILPPLPIIPRFAVRLAPSAGTACASCAVVGAAATLTWTLTDGPANPLVHVNGADVNSCQVATGATGTCQVTFSTPGDRKVTLTVDPAGLYTTASLELPITVLGCYVVYVAVSGKGTVGGLPAPTCSGPIGPGYIQYTSLQVNATPGPGQTFAGWDTLTQPGGSATGSPYLERNRFIFVTEDTYLRAVFTVTCYSVGFSPADYFTRARTGGWIEVNTGSNCVGRTEKNGDTIFMAIAAGTRVTFTAHPEPGQQLYSWIGSPASNTYTVEVNDNLFNLAAFASPCRAVTTSASAGGSVVATGGFPCNDPVSGVPGYHVDVRGYSGAPQLTATPDPGYFLDRWERTSKRITDVTSVRAGGVQVLRSDNRSDSSYRGEFLRCAVLRVGIFGDLPAPPPQADVTPGNCPLGGSTSYYPGTEVHILVPFSLTVVTDEIDATYGKPYKLTRHPGLEGFTSTPDLPTYTIGSGYRADQKLTMTTDRTVNAAYAFSGTCRPVDVSVQPASMAPNVTFSADFNQKLCRQYGTNHYLVHQGDYLSLDVKTNSGKIQPFWQVCCDMYVDWQDPGRKVTAHDRDRLGIDYLYPDQTYGYSGARGVRVNRGFEHDGHVTYTLPYSGGMGPNAVNATAWYCGYVKPTFSVKSEAGVEHPELADQLLMIPDPLPNCPDDGWTVGTVVKWTILPGYRFNGWTGEASGTSLTYNMTVDANTPLHHLGANFTANCYKLTVQNGDSTAVAPKPNCPDTDASQNRYLAGSPIAFKATDRPPKFGVTNGDTFEHWSVNGVTAPDPALLTIDRDSTVEAVWHHRSDTEAAGWVSDQAGIAAKKGVGLIAGMLASAAQSTEVGFMQALIGAAKGATWIASQAGADPAKIAAANRALDYIQKTADFALAPLTCAGEWGRGTSGEAATTTTDEAKRDAKKPTIEAIKLAKEEWDLAHPQAVAPVTGFMAKLGYLKKAMKNVAPLIGPAMSLGTGIYEDVTVGNWDASSHDAWTSGGDAFAACMRRLAPDVSTL